MSTSFLKKAMEEAMKESQEKLNQQQEIVVQPEDFSYFLLNSDYRKIGDYVYSNRDVPVDVLTAAVSVCRRKFNQKDMVVLNVLDEGAEGECGVAFTKDKLHYWEADEDYKGGIRYMDIADVDYEEDMVTVSTVEEEININCRDTYYARYMYNFLMDIKELAEGLKQ